MPKRRLRAWSQRFKKRLPKLDQIVNDPRLEPIRGTFLWKVLEPFDVQDDVLGAIEVPVGFVTDLGSIPRIFWNLIPPEGPATDGYVIHDFCYAKQFCVRYDADNCLLRLMAVLGVSWLSRYTVYESLRAFGWVAWNADAKKALAVGTL